MYSDSGGGLLRPEIVASPKMGALALIGLDGALKLASALIGITFFNGSLVFFVGVFERIH